MTSLIMTSHPGFTVSVHSVFRCEGWILRYNVWAHEIDGQRLEGSVLLVRLGSRVSATEAIESLGLTWREAEAAIEAALDSEPVGA